VITTIVSILLSRELGAEGRGVVSWMMAFAGFGAVCVVLGLGAALKKYVVKMPERTSGFISSSIIVVLLSLLVFMPILYFGGQMMPIVKAHQSLFICALVMIPYLAFSNLFNEALIGLGHGLHYNKLYIIEKGINIILNISLLALAFVQPVPVMAAYMFAVLCRFAVSIKFMRPHIKQRPTCAEFWGNFGVMRKLVFSSYFGNLAMYFAGSWLTIALGLMSNTKELGYFVIAKTLTDAGLMFPTALAAFVLPQLAKENEQAARERTIKYILIFAFALVCLIALPMFLFPHFIINLLFGSAFISAASCLPVLAAGMVFAGVILVVNPIIASHHKEHRVMINSGILAFSIVLLTFVFKGSLNAITASYIYTAAYMLGLVVSLILVFMQKPKRQQ